MKWGSDEISYYELLSKLNIINKRPNEVININDIVSKMQELTIIKSNEISFGEILIKSFENAPIIVSDVINVVSSAFSWYVCQIGISCPISWVTIQAIPAGGSPAYYSYLRDIIAFGYKSYFETFPSGLFMTYQANEQTYELPVEIVNLRDAITKVQIYPIDEKTWQIVDNKILLTKQNISADIYLMPKEKKEVKLYLPVSETGTHEYYFLIYAESGLDVGSEIIKITGVVSEFNLINAVKTYVVRYSLLILITVGAIIIFILIKNKIKNKQRKPEE
jgi:hypothetical protein